VFVFDREGRWLWAAEPLIARGDNKRANADLVIGRTLHDVLPKDTADYLLDAIHRALQLNETQYAEYAVNWLGGQLWFLAAISPMPNDNVVWVARNISGRKQEEERLAEEVKHRTRELSALFEISRALSSTLELQPLLELMLDQLRLLVHYEGAGISLVTGEMIVQLAVRRPEKYRDMPESGPTTPQATFGPAWDRLSQGETVTIDDVLDDSLAAQLFRRSWGGDLRGTAVEYIRSMIIVPLITREKVIGTLNLAHGEPSHFTREHVELVKAVAAPTAAAIANARLFQQTQARTRELDVLLEISRTLASTLDAKLTLNAILNNLTAITEYTGASILLLRDDAFEFVEARSISGARAEIGARIPFTATPTLSAAMRQGQTVIIGDIRADTPMAAGYRAAIASMGVSDRAPFNIIRSWMAVPLTLQDRVLGSLTISWTEPNHFTEDHSRLARAFADQAAVAMEHAHLYEEAQQRAREFEALSRADQELFRSLDLNTVLQALVDVTVDVLGAEKSMVATWDGGISQMRLRAWRNISDEALDLMRDMYGRGLGRIEDSQIITIEDPANAHPAEAEVVRVEELRSYIQVPVLSSGGEPLGFFSVGYTSDHHFDEDERRLLAALADRAAVAIGNADVYERSQFAASLEERQRLARELHDSVSQALYGIALGARTARTILDRDPIKAIEPVEYVLDLAEAGLAEMRALIFELRPESLETEGIVAALDKQIAATSARYQIAITANLCDEPDISLDRKEVLYRIAQEALHNTVKHARATSVRISLEHLDSRLSLTVSDDGVGFDPGGEFPGHLGLKSMRERVTHAGGDLCIDSKPGAGTTVTAAVPGI